MHTSASLLSWGPQVAQRSPFQEQGWRATSCRNVPDTPWSGFWHLILGWHRELGSGGGFESIVLNLRPVGITDAARKPLHEDKTSASDFNVGLRHSQKAIDGLRRGRAIRAGRSNQYPIAQGKLHRPALKEGFSGLSDHHQAEPFGDGAGKGRDWSVSLMSHLLGSGPGSTAYWLQDLRENLVTFLSLSVLTLKK